MWKLCCIVVFYVDFTFRAASSQSETSNRIICERSTSTIQCSSSIRIISATYGRTESNVPGCSRDGTFNCSRDVLESLRELCDGKRSCNLEADNRLYGDPCRGVLKYLNITYLCIETSNKIICESSTSTIQCSSSIRITSATYGRTESNVPGCSRGGTFNCSRDVLESLKELCDGKRSCNLEAGNRLYGDPCPNVLKYLNTTYFCKVEFPPMTTEKSLIRSEVNPSTPEGSGEMATSEEPLNTSKSVSTLNAETSTFEVPMITGQTSTNTESEESIVIGIVAGVAVAVGLIALFIGVVLFRKRRSRLASNQTEAYHIYEGDNTQKEHDKQKTSTTNDYLDVSGSYYSHKYQDLTPANGVKSKIDESDERGIYYNDKCPDMTSGNQTVTENIYDYIDESTTNDKTDPTTEYCDLDKHDDENQYLDLK